MMIFMERPCPTCGLPGRVVAHHPEPKPALYGLDATPVPLRRCPRCTLTFFDLIPGVNEYGEIYARMPLSASRPKPRHTVFAELIDRLHPASTGLEFGAGACHAGRRLAGAGHRVVAVDQYSGRAEPCPGIDFVDADCTALPPERFPAASFDWILADNVLEHLPRYRELMDNCKRWLKPGGLLVASVPNAHTLAQFVSARHRRQVYRPVEHVNNFTAASLDALFAQIGCRRVRAPVRVRSMFEFSVWLSVNAAPPFGLYRVYRA